MKILLILLFFSQPIYSKDYIIKLKQNALYTGNATNIISYSKATYIVVNSDTLPNDPSFEFVEEDHDISILTRNSPQKQEYFSKQWALENLGKNEPITPNRMSPVTSVTGIETKSLEAWKLSTGSKDITIALVDTGVDLKHIELKENLWMNPLEANGLAGVDDDGNGFIDDINGFDFSAQDSIPQDENGHGTHCACIIGASHSQGKIAGVMANVSIMPLRTLNKKGAGKVSQAIEAFIYAIENGANIISNSWGSRGHSKILEELIIDANAKGIHVVAAAGNARFNNNDEAATYPANYPGVIAVGAINARARHAAYSSYGPKTMHLSAPGTNIISSHTLRKGERYRVMSGTSMAAPYVSGAIGLYLSLNGKSQKPLFIRNALIESATKLEHLKGMSVSEGMLNVSEFLNIN